MSNNTPKFKNALISALYGSGIPVWTRDQGWIDNGKLGANNSGAPGPAGGGGAPGPAGPMQAPGGLGGPMRPRGGMMGISPFRINTRYTKGR
jgi:hypothetical protein